MTLAIFFSHTSENVTPYFFMMFEVPRQNCNVTWASRSKKPPFRSKSAELELALNAGQEAIIRPYRERGITAKEAVAFLKAMGVLGRKQCPEFDHPSGIIDDILLRKKAGRIFYPNSC
jgi:hypothetical protein